MRNLAAPLLLLATALAGCLGGADVAPAGAGTAAAFAQCEHPWPCADGSEWPAGLAGPFGLRAMERVMVPSHDGVDLEGYLFLPELPAAARAPVVLQATPYTGVCNPGFNAFPASGYACNRLPDASWAEAHWLVAPLLRAGYAVAVFSTRGTGGSGGCFGQHSDAEQRDYAHLVGWLAGQAWSNGRVGMYGLSYHGTTPFDAAIHDPPALKTIVAGGIISDWYTFYATPQGAKHPLAAWREASYQHTVSHSRSIQALLVHQDPSFLPLAAERAGCAEAAKVPAEEAGWAATEDRDEAWFAERRLIDRFPGITTSVLVVQGFNDAYGSGHADQEDYAWHALAQAPKRMLLGQWAHEFPREEGQLEGSPAGARWDEDALLPWLDFWLKGLGAPPRVGAVDHADTAGAWRTSAAWPPPEARREVLWLDGLSLSRQPGAEGRSLLATLAPLRQTHCAEADREVELAYFAEPVGERVVLAGNPFVHLEVASDQPGGIFQVLLFDAGPDVTDCASLHASDDVRLLTTGAVDLRYHAGNFEGRDFPTGSAQAVRADLFNHAWVLEPGRRLVFELVRGDLEWTPYHPRLVFGPGSHLVLPVLEGSAGGAPPGIAYPPRPFVPDVAQLP